MGAQIILGAWKGTRRLDYNKQPDQVGGGTQHMI